MPKFNFSGSIYRCIFADAAKIDVSLVPLANPAAAAVGPDLDPNRRKARDRRLQAINSFFVDFKPNPKFREFLRNIASTYLEEALYGNCLDDLGDDLPYLDDSEDTPVLSLEKPTPSDARFTISDEHILKKFKALNLEYGYPLEDDATAFIKIFKLCKVIADYIECNNTAQNELAYLHAYKLLVLFGKGPGGSVFSKIEEFLSQHDGKISTYRHPIHDLLVHSIPINVPPMTKAQLQQWQSLIREAGTTMLPIFQQAPQINHLLGDSPPLTLKEAKEASTQLIYPRAKENPVLATLCAHYHVSDVNFDKCLEITPRTKIQDNLPSVIISGGMLQDATHPEQKNYPGYYLVKLPIGDPRAYILGVITNCCQSIGGHSESCVIDGITLENNGFYVLLKGDALEHPLSAEGQIRYDLFTIVGQGYAWISQEENLTFDSWENLTPAAHNEVIVPMLERFAEVVSSDPQHPNILQVTIGTGGKTPYMPEKRIVKKRESMKEGVFYGDARSQKLIYLNAARQLALKEKIRAAFQAIKDRGYSDFGQRLLDKADKIGTSTRLLQLLNDLFLSADSLDMWNKATDHELSLLTSLIYRDNLEDLIIRLSFFVTFKRVGLMEGEMAKQNRAKVSAMNTDFEKLDVLLNQHRATLLSGPGGQKNFQAIASPTGKPYKIADALLLLHTAGLLDSEESQEYRDALAKHADPKALAQALLLLHTAGLLDSEESQEYRDALAKHAYPKALAQALLHPSILPFMSGMGAGGRRSAVISHWYFSQLIDNITFFSKGSLLSGEKREDNFFLLASCTSELTVLATKLDAKGLFGGARAQDIFMTFLLRCLHNPALINKVIDICLDGEFLSVEQQKEANFLALANHRHMGLLCWILSRLHEKGLLADQEGQDIIMAVVQHEFPFAIKIALDYLETVNASATLTKYQCLTMAKHEDPRMMARIFSKWDGYSPSMEKEFCRVLETHKDPEAYAEAIKKNPYAFFKSEKQIPPPASDAGDDMSPAAAKKG